MLVLACGALALQPELRLAVPMLIGITAVMVTLLTLALYGGERARPPWSPGFTLAVALLLRLVFLCSPPQLSDDAYRYLWDGSNTLRGVNPYAAAPALVAPPAQLKSLQARINHPEYVTIYPPAAQIVFAGGAALGGTITGLKALLVLLDLGLCALLLLALRQLAMPEWLALLYAWNPLPVLEIAGSGHVDGAGLTLLIGSFCLIMMELRRASGDGARRWPLVFSGALLACSCLVKLFPLVLSPLLFLLVPRSRRVPFCAGFLGTLTALLLLFMPQLTNMTASLDAYARNWEFAGFAFNTLRSLTGSGTAARMVLSSCFALFGAGVTFRFALGLRQLPAPAERGRRALAACYRVTLALLLLTPTLQPWYALALAALLPFCAGPAGLVLCWVVFLTYQVQIPYFIRGEWIENPQVTAAVFLAPLAAYLLGSAPRCLRRLYYE